MYKLQNPFVSTVVELIITPLKLLELEVKKSVQIEITFYRVLRCSLDVTLGARYIGYSMHFRTL